MKTAKENFEMEGHGLFVKLPGTSERTSNVGIPPCLKRAAAFLFSLVAMLALCSINLMAQPFKGGSGSNYVIRLYYPKPDYAQVKYELTGREAVSLTNGAPGRIALTQLRIAQFSVKGERELLIEAPGCIYDDNTKEASSSGRLQIEYGKGQLRLGGEGFLWQHQSQSLVISNDVNATVRLQTNAAAPLQITSRWFVFDVTNRHAVFHEKVHGVDAELDFTCDALGVRGGTNSQTMNAVEAAGNVTMLVKAMKRKLAAQHCVYTRADDRAVLSRDVTWSQGRMSGRADRVTAYQVSQKNSRNIDAQGHVTMKLPPEDLQAAGGFLSGTNKPAAGRTNSANSALIDVAADRFTSISNQLTLLGSVQLSDATNKLTCDRIEAVSTASGAPGETAVATGHVVLKQGDARIAAERAAYSRSDGRIVFTGEPNWQASNFEGRAQQLIASTVSRELFAQNGVTVRYTLEPGSASLFDFFPSEETQTNNTPATIEIKSRTFTVSGNEREAVFAGGVNAQHMPADGAEPRLVSESLTLKFTPGGTKPESFRARGNVAFEQGTSGVTNGPATYRLMKASTVTARTTADGALDNLVAEGDVTITLPDALAKCARVMYTAGDQLLALTGTPTLDTSQFKVSEAEKLVWDRTNNRFRAEGRSRTVMKSLTLPPELELPKLK